MKVKAKKLLFHGNTRIYEGEEFVLLHRKGVTKDGEPIEITPEQQFSSESMIRLDQPQKREQAPKRGKQSDAPTEE